MANFLKTEIEIDLNTKPEQREIPDYGFDLTEPLENEDGKLPFEITYYNNDGSFWDKWIENKYKDMEQH